MMMHCFKLFFLVGLTIAAAVAPASATWVAGGGWRVAGVSSPVIRHPPPATHVASPVLFADGFSFGKWFSGGGRTRVVQFCAAAMCLALFIMMRKLQ